MLSPLMVRAEGPCVLGWLFLQLLPLVSNKHLISLLINYRVRRSTSARSSVRPRRLRPLVNCFLDLSSGATSRALAFSLDPRFGKDLSRKTFCFCAEDIRIPMSVYTALFSSHKNRKKNLFQSRKVGRFQLSIGQMKGQKNLSGCLTGS